MIKHFCRPGVPRVAKKNQTQFSTCQGFFVCLWHDLQRRPSEGLWDRIGVGVTTRPRDGCEVFSQLHLVHGDWLLEESPRGFPDRLGVWGRSRGDV